MPETGPLQRTTARHRRGPYAKGTERRSEILAAALTVIGEQGAESASIGAIAAEVGLSPTGVMHYFSTRTELFVEVLKERDRQDRMRADGRAGLEALRGAVGRNTRTPALVLLYVSLTAAAADPGPEAREFFTVHHHDLLRLVAVDLAAGQADGSVRTDLPVDTLARLLVATADGLQLQWLMDPSFEMIDALDLLLAILRP